VKVSLWPSMRGERRSLDVGDALQRRLRRLGRQLYVALLPRQLEPLSHRDRRAASDAIRPFLLSIPEYVDRRLRPRRVLRRNVGR